MASFTIGTRWMIRVACVQMDGTFQPMESGRNLTNFLGGSAYAWNTAQGFILTSPLMDGTMAATSRTTVGFRPFRAAYRYYDGDFYDAGDYGYWWSSSPSGGNAWSRSLTAAIQASTGTTTILETAFGQVS